MSGGRGEEKGVASGKSGMTGSTPSPRPAPASGYRTEREEQKGGEITRGIQLLINFKGVEIEMLEPHFDCGAELERCSAIKSKLT